MTIVLTKANRWRFEILPRLFGVILLTGICVGTVHLLGVLAIYFVPMYVVSYLQHLDRPNRLTLLAAAVLVVVLSVLSWL